MKRRNNKLEHCFRSLTVLTRSTTKCTTKPVGKKFDRLAIEFEATAFKAALRSPISALSTLKNTLYPSLPSPQD